MNTFVIFMAVVYVQKCLFGYCIKLIYGWNGLCSIVFKRSINEIRVKFWMWWMVFGKCAMH